MEKKNPLVSIVIPLYNTRQWIKQMVDSILSQTYINWELLIVDDGSSDGSRDLVQSYNDIRIKLIDRDREPKGAQSCRNIGIEKALGKYIIFFDSDDLISSTCLEKRVSFMENNENLDFGVFGCNTFTTLDEIRSIDQKKGGYGRNHSKDVLGDFLKTTYPFLVVTNIYKLDSLKHNCILWDEDIKGFQDFRFNFRCINIGLKYLVHTPYECDYFYRIGHTNQNISKKLCNRDKFESTLNLIDRVHNELKVRNDYLLRKKQFLGFCLNYYRFLVFSKTTDLLAEFEKYILYYYSKDVLLRMQIMKSLLIQSPLSFKYTNRIFKLFVRIFFRIRIV